MNIIVLCGGLSNERDVSLSSGRKVAGALRELGHRAVLVDLFFGYRGTYGDPAEIFDRPCADEDGAIAVEAPDLEAVRKSRGGHGAARIGDNVIEVCRAADLVFMALHGEDGENGKVQALFDVFGIRYTGCGYLGSAMAMNKGVAKDLFRQNGILTPKGVVLRKDGDAQKAPCLPCVVKPRSGGSSVGTSIARTEEEFRAALQLGFRYEDEVIAEEYIRGRECDVAVLDGKALPVIEICPKTGFYDYKNKYQSGMTDEYCPADLSPEVTETLQRAAEDVYRALLLEVYARMDFIVDGSGRCYCLEANTLPGLTPMSLLPQEAAAAGIPFTELCRRIIDLSLAKYR